MADLAPGRRCMVLHREWNFFAAGATSTSRIALHRVSHGRTGHTSASRGTSAGGPREADRVIQAVIQIQSVFAKGTDPSIQEFARHALADKHGDTAATSLEQFRASGWTADMLEALADADVNATPDERERLATGLRQFNLSVDDFRRFMQLVRDGRSALTERGLAFEEVYARHRSAMPGAAR